MHAGRRRDADPRADRHLRPTLATALAKFGVERLYDYISYLDRESRVTLLNYGYDGPSDVEDGPDRRRLQLYRHVASVELTGKDVLEVGAGRGGGAAYLTRRFAPRSYQAVDLSARAVRFCIGHHRVPGLTFARQDAERLDGVGDATVDVVLNVESSHNYPHLDRFVRQVHRVLRPGGFFLYADMRSSRTMDALLSLLDEAGFEVVAREEITPRVLAALDADSDEKLRLLERTVPAILMRPMKAFAGIRGTSVYAKLRSGQLTYFNLALRKVP